MPVSHPLSTDPAAVARLRARLDGEFFRGVLSTLSVIHGDKRSSYLDRARLIRLVVRVLDTEKILAFAEKEGLVDWAGLRHRGARKRGKRRS
jgi:hypothetical protein